MAAVSGSIALFNFRKLPMKLKEYDEELVAKIFSPILLSRTFFLIPEADEILMNQILTPKLGSSISMFPKGKLKSTLSSGLQGCCWCFCLQVELGNNI